jgi:outer membrane protein TolC
MTAVAASNPAANAAAATHQAAEGVYTSARGVFDPLYFADASFSYSRATVLLPFLYTAIERSTVFDTGVAGTTGTGTGYSLTAALVHNYAVGETGGAQFLNTAALNVGLTQELLRGIRSSYTLQQVRVARKGADAADLAAQAARQTALAQAAAAYWNWYYAIALEKVAEDSVAIAQEDVRVAQVGVDNGTVAHAELARRQGVLAADQSAALEQAIAARTAGDALTSLMGADAAELDPATEAGEPPAITLDPAQVLEATRAGNLELASAKASLEAAQDAARGAKAGKMASLQAEVNAGLAADDQASAIASVTGLFDQNTQPYFEVGGHFQVPIGNRSARGEADRRAAEADAQTAAVREVELRIAAEAATQLRELEAAQQRVSLADARVAAGQEALTAEETALARGGSNPVIVLVQRQELEKARGEAFRARAEWRIAQAQLLALQGKLGTDLP